MRILNFGSLNIDHVFTLDHFVQPGETTASTDYFVNMGGKGHNQTIAFARAGAKVYHAGQVGHDGAKILEGMAGAGVDTSNIRVVDTPTGMAMIQVDAAGQNAIILYAGANHQQSEMHIDQVLDGFGEGDYIVLQNEVNNMPYIMKRAHEKSLRIIFNPSPFAQAILAYPLDLVWSFILNEIEGKALSGKEKPQEMCGEIIRKYRCDNVVLTLGEEGSCFMNVDGFVTAGSVRCEAVDTTAAGDTFTGYFYTEYLTHGNPGKALHFAAKAASITVSRSGASETIPTRDEVE